MIDLWYKNAVIYCIDVDTYMDANGDGIGDFEGLTQRLDYIAGLGITCIWLSPFYPTPNKDNGYDVMDYYNVDPRLGTLGDFVEFTRQAHERGLRIIVDLVVNHTSDQHPWFQAACQDKNSKYRNYYVWSEEKPENADEGVVFPGFQESTWTYNETAGAYYSHRFYDHQADLNITNPQVREEIQKIMGFWIALGVSGFRVDAAQFLVEARGNKTQFDVESPYLYLKQLRDFLSWRRGDAILLAEANVGVKDLPKFFGDGDIMQMLFNFIANQHLVLGLAQEKATPLIEALQSLPEIPPVGQWANFIRNHDELTLDKLTDAEQDQIVTEMAPDRERMWIFDRGIRRRFAPLVDGDPRRLRLAYSLMLTLPGTPVINYGEELGMGDDLSLPERNPARTPMQWSNQPNAGFSTAPPDQLIRPVVSEGKYSYEHLNVAKQRRDPNSFLNWMESAIRMRKECRELGWGSWQILETGHPSVMALCCEWQGGTVIPVHNFAATSCTVRLKLNHSDGKELTDLLADQSYELRTPTAPELDPEIELEGYGFRWLRVGGHNL